MMRDHNERCLKVIEMMVIKLYKDSNQVLRRLTPFRYLTRSRVLHFLRNLFSFVLLGFFFSPLRSLNNHLFSQLFSIEIFRYNFQFDSNFASIFYPLVGTSKAQSSKDPFEEIPTVLERRNQPNLLRLESIVHKSTKICFIDSKNVIWTYQKILELYCMEKINSDIK